MEGNIEIVICCVFLRKRKGREDGDYCLTIFINENGYKKMTLKIFATSRACD